MFRRLRYETIAIFCFAWLVSWPAKADFVELEKLLDGPAASLAEKVQGTRVVVAVRNGAQPAMPWDIRQAAGVEITEALRRRHVDAIRAAADPRLNDLEAVDRLFTARHAQAVKQVGRDVLVGIEWFAAKKTRVKIVAYSHKSPKVLWMKFVDVPEAAQSLEKNLDPMNRAAVEFAKKSLGGSVREGDCTHLAEDCLKAAGTGKRGVYRWGRELGPREPWLPGDIVQMERATVTAPDFARGFAHHTAVVEEASGERIVVLHQNAFPQGKLVQRETWPVAGMSGEIAAYRPWNWPPESPLPPASPRRVSPPFRVADVNGKPSKPIDLLKLADPHLDRVQGIWFFDGDGLRSPCEFEARMQIPVVPPKLYRLRMSVERLQGAEQFGLGIVVSGRQTMLSIDGFNSRFTGIHNLDGKPANDNESTKAGTFLPLHKRVELECRVGENEIELDIDKTHLIEWRGDAKRLSLSPDWPVPHGDWLFISAYNSEFDIDKFVLEPVK
jgi:hypothetical protein